MTDTPQPASTDKKFPLAGLKVLDLSRVLAGPIAGRILSDLGADVVKVEPPEGDVTRIWGKRIAGLSGFYTQQNAGKRNVSVDLGAPGGPELVMELAAVADIVVENFRPGVLARYGLDYAHIKARNPSVVMLSISGFGQDGPESRRAAYAPVLHAETGYIARAGEFFGEPADSAQALADTFSGLQGLVGLLTALYWRSLTGEGQHIDLAMADAMSFTDEYAHFALDGVRNMRGIADLFPGPNGPILVAGDFKWIWHQLSKVHGLRDDSPDDATLEDKIARREAVIDAWFRSFTDREPLLAALDAANLAWGEVKSGADIHSSPTLQHRESVREIDNRAGGTRRILRAPQRFSTLAADVQGPAPYRGEHNAEVLADWLGREVTEVADGVLLEEPRP